jgi:pilus assembly protein Flp/PilA
MMKLARTLWNDESGQGLSEYALLLGLIVVGVVLIIASMGESIKNIFTRADTDLNAAEAGGAGGGGDGGGGDGGD